LEQNSIDAAALALIVDALELPPNYHATADAPIADVPGWDSYAWIAVIGRLEDYCGCEFPVDRIDEVKSIGDLLRIVRELKSN